MERSGVFSSKEPLQRLHDLNLLHCPTIELPVRMSGDYSQSVIGVSKWKPRFLVLSGINKPKRIEMIGSNGRSYLQLLKGNWIFCGIINYNS